MTDFIIKKLPYDLTSNAGLALVGQYFKRLGINQRIDPKFPISGKGISNSVPVLRRLSVSPNEKHHTIIQCG